MRLATQASHQQALRNPCPPMPSIIAVGEFFPIEWAPGASAPVIGFVTKGFRETNHRIDPVKDLGCLGIPTQGDSMLGFMGFRARRVSAPSLNPTPTFEHLQHRFLFERLDGFQKGILGMAFGIHTDPDDHPILVGAAALLSLSMTDAAKIGVIELNQSIQRVLGVAIGHRPLSLMVQ